MGLQRLLVLITHILLLWIVEITPGLASQFFTLFSASNIPFSLTTGSNTSAIKRPQLTSYTDNTCSNSYNSGDWASGAFTVLPNSTTTVYLSTINGQGGSGGATLAELLCPGGTTHHYVQFSHLENQNGTNCTLTTPGCFTVNCSASATVSGGLSGTLASITCP